MISWDRTGQKENDYVVKRRQYSSDAAASLIGDADREVSQPDFLVREGSLQAGEDLPDGVSIPGALVGGLQPVPPAKKLGSWENRRVRGRIYGSFNRDPYH